MDVSEITQNKQGYNVAVFGAVYR